MYSEHQGVIARGNRALYTLPSWFVCRVRLVVNTGEEGWGLGAAQTHIRMCLAIPDDPSERSHGLPFQDSHKAGGSTQIHEWEPTRT